MPARIYFNYLEGLLQGFCYDNSKKKKKKTHSLTYVKKFKS